MGLFNTGKTEERPDYTLPIPSGRYLMSLDNLEQKISRAGNNYIKATFIILGKKDQNGDIDFFQSNRRYWENYMVSTKWGLALFGQLAIGLGYDYTINENGNDIDVDDLIEESGATTWEELEPFLIADMLERANVRGGLWLTLGVGADSYARKRGNPDAMKNYTNKYESASEEEIEEFLYADDM